MSQIPTLKLNLALVLIIYEDCFPFYSSVKDWGKKLNRSKLLSNLAEAIIAETIGVMRIFINQRGAFEDKRNCIKKWHKPKTTVLWFIKGCACWASFCSGWRTVYRVLSGVFRLTQLEPKTIAIEHKAIVIDRNPESKSMSMLQQKIWRVIMMKR